MAARHDLLTYVDGSHVGKAAVRNGFRDFTPHGMTVAEVQATDMQGARWLVVAGFLYALDAADVTTVHNGASVLVSSNGGRYKIQRQGREVLTAARTYFVATTGSDANSGLSVGSPFLTIQAAYNRIADTLDLGGQLVTIKVAAGTYAGGLTIANPWTGGGRVILEGDTSNPNSVFISPGSFGLYGVYTAAPLPGPLTVRGLSFQTAGNSIQHTAAGVMWVSAVNFSTCGGYHVAAQAPGADVTFVGPYTISGGAVGHIAAQSGGHVFAGVAITLTGTPAFGFTFAYLSALSSVDFPGATFTGAATGQRYYVAGNSVVSSGGVTLPGSTAGAVVTGGQYL